MMTGRPAPFVCFCALVLQGTACATTLIGGARVVDGTGAPPRQAAVRIDGDRIAGVGNLERRPGETLVDATGLVLAPGFIDTHSHHDVGLFEQPDALAAVSQGITTIVVGQDGSSSLPVQSLLERVESNPAAVNVASYIGHNAVRGAVMGDDYRRAATASEIRRMRALVRSGMRAGALGLSTGLEYDPGIYATTEEVIALACEASLHGGRYLSHIRSEDVGLDEAISEIITIGRTTGMPVQISHIKLAMVDRWGQAPQLLERLNEARAEGILITADIYPYTYWESTMTVLFPERDFASYDSAEFALTRLTTSDGMILSRFRPDPSLVGKSIAEVAALRNDDPVVVYMDLIAAAQAYQKERGLQHAWEVETVIATSMDSQDVAALLAWPHTNVGSDGFLTGGHPRGAGSFTRVLRQYVREEGLLRLEEAIYKMSGLAAMHVGLSRRGSIQPGQFADLVLIDPETVADRATVDNPSALSVGIEKVWVNGQIVFSDGDAMGLYPGRALRKKTGNAWKN